MSLDGVKGSGFHPRAAKLVEGPGLKGCPALGMALVPQNNEEQEPICRHARFSALELPWGFPATDSTLGVTSWASLEKAFQSTPLLISFN